MKLKYSPFDEDIVVVGAKNSGKTSLVKKILSDIGENIPYWIYDFNWQYGNFGQVVHEVKDLQYGQYVFQPRDKSYETFIKFCERVIKAAQTVGNLVIVIEELHQYVTKQRACPELYTIVMTCRNQGISCIFISTVYTAIPNWILTNVEHVFAFRLNLVGHIGWLEQYVGVEAWQLIPPDKRKKLKDLPMLPDHSCVYRKQSDAAPIIIEGSN